MTKKAKKIVMTGAPSSGKSTALEEIRKVFGDQVVLVPESAVVLLAGGFPAPAHGDLEQIRCFQKAILAVQENLEDIFERKNTTGSPSVLDRAKLDGAGFWPPGPQDYLKNFGLDLAQELARYDHVLFLELPEEKYFGGVLQTRFHNYEQSKASEKKLAEVWSQHPSFLRIPAQADFNKKIEHIIQTIKALAFH